MKQDNNDKAPSSRKKVSKSLKARIQKHLTDKNDVITDDDIKNIQVGEGEDGPVEDKKDAADLANAINEKKVTSPWTILSEEDK
jgi:hypothetical protein